MSYIKETYTYSNGHSKYEYHIDDMVFYGETEDDVLAQFHQFNMDKESAKQLDIKYIKSSNFRVDVVSLVGVNASKYPVSFGNYWSINIDGKGYSVLNMWCENFEEAIKLFNIKTLRFAIINGLCIIDDNQIPSDWYLNDLFMGYKGKGMTFIEWEKLNEWYKSNTEGN